MIGDETYQHAAGVYQAGSGEAGTEALNRRSMSCIASTYIPAAASMKQSAILHAAGPNGGAMRGDSVAAMWPTLGSDPRYLLASLAKASCSPGLRFGTRQGCVPGERLCAARHPNFELTERAEK